MVIRTVKGYKMDDKIAKALKSLPPFNQRQDGTMDQFRDLERIAVKFGMYDAADHIRLMLQRYDAQIAKINEENKK
ncbi:hypothetical protein [Acinetobacter sp.]|uniref:hypothetical protein n=1 Tax=Acinetobacter sp. TaxID=472 RepID=UPI00388FB208